MCNINHISKFLEQYVDQIEPIGREAALAYWVAATTGSDEAEKQATELEARLMRIHADKEAHRRLGEWVKSPPGDPLLARQVYVTYLSFARGQQDDSTIDAITQREQMIRSRFSNYRGVYRSRPLSDNDLVQIMNGETDPSAVKEAWQAGKQIGRQVAATVLETIELRNDAARRMGSRDHYKLNLELNEINEDRLFAILDDLDGLTVEPFREAKAGLDRRLAARFGVAVEDLRSWHYGDPFFQRPPQSANPAIDELFAGRDVEDLAVRTYDGLGLDIRDILERSDMYAREKKNQHAFCMDVDRKGDVRVLCNLESNVRWAETILHEFGHGVFDKYNDPDLPYLLRQPAHTLSTEAIAMLMGRLALDEEWLTNVAGVEPATVGRLAPELRDQGRLGMLIFVRWMLVMCHFERQLYLDPKQDLNTLWWDMVEKYQLLHRPEGRDEPDWAAKIHLALHPVYYQNYILGELSASQLKRNLLANFGGLVDNPRAGRFLIERVFRPGAVREWDSALEYATGEKLNPRYFVEEFVEPV